jgi:hydrogenase/urease accessory protein HupE
VSRAVVVVVLLVGASPALAHQVGLSRGLYTATDDGLDLELVLARGEVAQAVPDVDTDKSGTVDARELNAAAAAFATDVIEQIGVSAEGTPCTGAFAGASLTEEDGLAVRGHWACEKPGKTTVDFKLVDRLSAGHRHLAHVVTIDGEQDLVAFKGSESFTFGSDAPPPSRTVFFSIGVEHILLGFDHLVFLFGLVLVGGRLRSMLAVITAFTAAHSITLALAVLGVFAPPPAVIEPLIALSIAYVGVENFFVKSAQGRWRITAPFGLVHGFGFAGALAEVGVPKDDVPLTLLLFNLGVEAGQLLVMAAVLPILWLLRKKGMLNEKSTRALSVVVIVLGVFWLIERVLGALGIVGA